MPRQTSSSTTRRRRNQSFASTAYQSLEPRQMLTCDFSVGSPNSGIAVSDDATGSGFIMYSPEPVEERFGGLHVDNAENFVAVQLDGAQWQYNNNLDWIDFEPIQGDVLVAEANFGADSVAMLTQGLSAIQSIPLANVEGELWFAANHFGGATDVGEFGMLGDCTEQDLSVFGDPGIVSNKNNLEQIASGTSRFESLVGEFPNLAIFDEMGSPLLSWRVQILPFIGMQDLYSQFHLDEPWNSTHNLSLLDQMPDVFRSESFESDTETVFMAMGGENTMFPLVSENIGYDDIPDGSSNTIMFVEANANRAAEWTRPVDLTYIEGQPLSGLGNASNEGFSVVMASGEFYTVPGDIDSDNFANMVERNDGDLVSFDEIEFYGDEEHNLRQITLASHNYESAYQRLPAHAIYSDTGEALLSWRVTILPYLEQNNLYERFNLDEAWDSPNNLALIPFMPKIYASEGLGDGLTNYVAVSGPGTIFEISDQGTTFGQIFDGSSNTLMFAAANPNQLAVEWTKPADLLFDPGDPGAGLGIDEVSFTGAFADGTVESIVDPELDDLTNMMLRDDGEFVEFSGIEQHIQLSDNLRQLALAAHNFESAHMHLPRDQYDRNNPGGPALLSWRVMVLPFLDQYSLFRKFDLNASWDSPQNIALLPFMPNVFATEGVTEAGMTSIQASKGTNTLFPGTEDDRIQIGNITDGSSNTAMILQVDASEAVEWTKPADLNFNPASPGNGLGGDGIGFWAAMGDAEIRFINNLTTENELGYFLQRNDGFSYLTNHLAPVHSTIVPDRSIQNDIRQIALAWHNYESALMHFPIHATYTERPNRGGTPLLSWRIAVLPFLEQNNLADQFNMDEAWDSPHNLSLIQYMPAIFRHPLLNAADGTTLTQTVNGPWDTGEPTTMSPLANTRVSFGHITDGPSNTMMITQSNIDQAVVWTKPEDILFNAADPSYAIGEAVFGFGNWIATGDGSTHFLSNCIDDESLSNLMLMNDGNAGGNWFGDAGYCNEGVVLPSVLGGSAGNDTVNILMLPDVFRVTINGVETDYSREEYDRLIIDTLGGNDEVTLTDGAEDNEAILSPGSLFVDGNLVMVESVEKISVISGGGYDVATLNGSATLGNQFFGTFESSLLLTPGFENRVSGYDSVTGEGGNGNDRAYFTDSSLDDSFSALPHFAQMTMGDISEEHIATRVNNFELYSATSKNGGIDHAFFFDTESNETFFGSDVFSRLTGEGYVLNATGFRNITARSSGGNDSAVLMDSTEDDTFYANANQAAMTKLSDRTQIRVIGFLEKSGFSRNGGADVAIITDESDQAEFTSNDELVGSPDSVTMTIGNQKIVAAGFGQVNASSTNGDDVANLIDSTGNDNFFATPSKSRLVGDHFFNLATGFSAVHAFSRGGNDNALIFDSEGDDQFFATPEVASLSGAGYRYSVRGFEDVRAVGSTGTDRASFQDSTGNDTFFSVPSYSFMEGANFFNQALGFGSVTGYSSNAGDVAQLKGSLGDDRLTIQQANTSLTGDGYFNIAVGFASVSTFGSSGNDTASIFDSSGDDTLVAVYSQLRLTGDEDGVEVSRYVHGFETTYANGTNGGSNDIKVGYIDFDLFRNGTWT